MTTVNSRLGGEISAGCELVRFNCLLTYNARNLLDAPFTIADPRNAEYTPFASSTLYKRRFDPALRTHHA